MSIYITHVHECIYACIFSCWVERLCHQPSIDRMSTCVYGLCIGGMATQCIYLYSVCVIFLCCCPLWLRLFTYLNSLSLDSCTNDFSQGFRTTGLHFDCRCGLERTLLIHLQGVAVVMVVFISIAGGGWERTLLLHLQGVVEVMVVFISIAGAGGKGHC